MQVTFLTMVKNLVEYRNYMPASILAGGGDDEEEVEKTPSEPAGDDGEGWWVKL